MHIIILSVQAVACAFIAAYSLWQLNKMAKGTPHLLRPAFAVLAAGGLAGLVGCFLTYDIFNCLFAVGVALFLAANRRGLKPERKP